MLCPKCFSAVQIINNAVFCPVCKVYLSDNVETFNSEYSQDRIKESQQNSELVNKKIKKGLLRDRLGHFGIRSVKYLAPVVLFVIFVLKIFLYADFENKCFIKIIPSSTLEFSNLSVKRAINILRLGSPEDYKELCERVSTIDANTDCGGFEGGCYRGGRKIAVSTSNRTISWTSAVIVHEVCHAKQANDARGFNEQECYAADGRLLKKIVQIE